MTSDAIIRPATVADVPAVLPMASAICSMHRAMDPDKYGFVGDIEARYARWLPQRARDPRSVFLVAEASSPIPTAGPDDAATPSARASGDQDVPSAAAPLVGFLIATIEAEIPIYEVKEFGFIHDAWVEPAWRGRGIGGRLVDAALARFVALGVSQVRLDTAERNEAARRLFESRGFRVSVREMIRALGR